MNPRKIFIALLLLASIAALFALDLGRYLSLAFLKQSQASFSALLIQQPVLVTLVFFAIYVAVTALSLPGVAIMTLATRYLLQGAIQKRFGRRLDEVNRGIDREGAFYLFTLRLIPAVPFFVLSLLMGLTRIPTRTYYWVGQLGILPATLLYVNAGTQIPRLETELK